MAKRLQRNAAEQRALAVLAAAGDQRGCGVLNRAMVKQPLSSACGKQVFSNAQRPRGNGGELMGYRLVVEPVAYDG